MRRYTFLSLALMLILFTECRNPSDKQSGSLNISDFSEPVTAHLKKRPGQQNIWGISLKIQGEFNGSLELWVGYNDSLYNLRYEYNDGLVEYDVEMADWYSDDCFLEFVPVNATKGAAEIVYTFHD